MSHYFSNPLFAKVMVSRELVERTGLASAEANN